MACLLILGRACRPLRLCSPGCKSLTRRGKQQLRLFETVPVGRRHVLQAATEGTEDALSALPNGAEELRESFDLEKFATSQGVVEPVVERFAEVDFLGESTEGNLHLVSRATSQGIVNVLGLDQPDDIQHVPFANLKKAQQRVLDSLEVPGTSSRDPRREVFCSRTLNLRAIQAIGYDMDYTLVNYSVDAWEGKAYEYGMQWLKEVGCPVDGLRFDPGLVIRGLIVDKEKGNLLKVDRFGYVKRAQHGTRMLSWTELRDAYGRELVSLRNERRYTFLNTLFSVSEAVMYMQLVDRLDQGAVPPQVVTNSYEALYKLTSKALYRTHVEGKLKAEIIQDPAKYVILDPDITQTLLDQKQAGKVLILITNSGFEYTDRMMSYAFNSFLPSGKKWRDLFDMVIVEARKPDFFSHKMSLYEVVTDDGLMRPAMTARKGGLYCGGSAAMVEKALGVEGDDILYVGDHLYTDAALAKINFRWRTALIVQELELEIEAMELGRAQRKQLKELMHKKELVGELFNQLRLSRQRYLAAQPQAAASSAALQSVNDTLAELLMVMERLDVLIGPMLKIDGEHFSERWGFLSRSGMNDKSQFTRQIEKYADIYTSRVSNFLRATPYMYFRSPSQSLVHDRHLAGLHGAQWSDYRDPHEPFYEDGDTLGAFGAEHIDSYGANHSAGLATPSR